MKSTYITILLLFFYVQGHAQFKNGKLYSFGTIITQKDTIRCHIEHQDEFDNIIHYKRSIDDKDVLQIKADSVKHLTFYFKNFDRIKVDNKNSYLMEKVCDGEVSLYKHSYITKSSYYRSGFGNSPGMMVNSSNEGEVYYVIKGTEVVKMYGKGLNKELKRLMPDDEQTLIRIDKLNFRDELFHFDLKEVISKYNFRSKF